MQPSDPSKMLQLQLRVRLWGLLMPWALGLRLNETYTVCITPLVVDLYLRRESRVALVSPYLVQQVVPRS